jgi:hypothetical protein
VRRQFLRALGYEAAANGLPLPALADEVEVVRERQRRADLLCLVLDAHGGLARWRTLSRFRATATVEVVPPHPVGPQASTPRTVVVTGAMRSPRVRITPYPTAVTSATWEPHRLGIETVDGIAVRVREDPEDPLETGVRRPWAEMDVAYVLGDAIWHHFVNPFILAHSDLVAEEVEARRSDGATWRRLRVTQAEVSAGPTRTWTYSFDDGGLLRRVEEFSASTTPAFVHEVSAHREFDGMMVPTRRRTYMSSPTGVQEPAAMVLSLEFSRVHLD